MDPLTKSYPMLTPYQFASNSPIAGIDLDGLEFSLSTTSDGVTYINAHFKILNSSSLSDENLKLLISQGVKKQYLEVMNRKYDGSKFKGWFTFDVVDDVQKGDYYIEIVDPSDDKLKIGKSKTRGYVNEIGGSNITYSTLGIKNEDFGGDLKNTSVLFNEGQEFSNGIIHEMGHLLGLLHPWDKRVSNDLGTFTQSLRMYDIYRTALEDPASELGDMIRKNLMNSGGNPSLFLSPFGEQSELTDEQFGQLYNNVYERTQKDESDDGSN